MGKEDSVGPRDSCSGGFRSWTGRGQSHEGRDSPHAGALLSAHETTRENDTRDGEGCLKVTRISLYQYIMNSLLNF